MGVPHYVLVPDQILQSVSEVCIEKNAVQKYLQELVSDVWSIHCFMSVVCSKNIMLVFQEIMNTTNKSLLAHFHQINQMLWHVYLISLTAFHQFMILMSFDDQQNANQVMISNQKKPHR